MRGTGILLEARSGHTRGEVGAPAQADIPDSARSDEGRVTGSRPWQSLRAVLEFVSIRLIISCGVASPGSGDNLRQHEPGDHCDLSVVTLRVPAEKRDPLLALYTGLGGRVFL